MAVDIYGNIITEQGQKTGGIVNVQTGQLVTPNSFSPITINSTNLGQSTNVPTYTPKADTTPYTAYTGSAAGYTTEPATPKMDEGNALYEQIKKSMAGLEGKTAYEQEQLTAAGYTPEKTARQRALSAQVNALNLESQRLANQSPVIQAQLQEQSAGRGITRGGLAPIEAGELRKNLLQQADIAQRSLTLQSEYAINAGDLQTAQETAQRAVDLKYKDSETRINNYLKQLEILTPFLNAEEKKRVENQTALAEQKKTELADLKSRQKDVWDYAQSQGDNASASAALELKPEDPQFTTKLAAIQVGIKAKATAQTPYITDENGQTVQYLKDANGAVIPSSRTVLGGTPTGGGGDKPLGILDVQRYNDLYPGANVIAGDTEKTANDKVAQINTPEAKLRNQIVGFQTAGNSYEKVVGDIQTSTTIKDKEAALKIVKEVYGISETPTPTTKPQYGQGNFAQTEITQRIEQLKNMGFSGGQIKTQLKQDGYQMSAISSAGVGNIIDKITSFLFGE